MSSTNSTNTNFYDVRTNQRLFSKLAVALRSAAFLKEGDSLLIDAGTSLTPMAGIVKVSASREPNQTHYTIMTHNKPAFDALSETPSNARFNVFQAGGRYDRDLNASFGYQAEIAYQVFRPRWVFMGQNGMEADAGLYCHGNTEELALKREIFAMPAFGRIILADFTKLGMPGGLIFGESSSLTTNVDHCAIVTDDPHDTIFASYWQESDRERNMDRFDREVRSLEYTYQVEVHKVHYYLAVIEAETYNKLNNLGSANLDIEKDIKKNWKRLNVKYWQGGNLNIREEDDIPGGGVKSWVFRLHLVKEDLLKKSQNEQLEGVLGSTSFAEHDASISHLYQNIPMAKLDEADARETLACVDFQLFFHPDDNSRIKLDITQAQMFWDGDGKSLIARSKR